MSKGGERKGSVDPDNYFSPMTIETYVQFRVKPLLNIVNSRTPVIAASNLRWTMLTLICTTVGTGLAAFGAKEWVVVSGGLATACTSISQHKKINERLLAYNTASVELQTMLVMMQSLSVVMRRTSATKTKCTECVENAILGTVFAGTSVTVPTAAGGGE